MTTENGNVQSDVDFVKLIPFATAGLIFLGVTRLYYYYQFFGINIVSFLDFSEILTSFFDIIIVVVIGLGLSWIQFIKIPEKKRSDETGGNARNEQKKARWEIFWSIIAILINGYFVYDSIKELLKENWRPIVIFLIFGGLGVLLGAWLYRMSKRVESRVLKNILLLTTIIVVSEMFVIFAATTEFSEVKHDQKYLGTSIVFNKNIVLKDSSKRFVSDSSNYYIGKTNNYVFIYHANENVTTVYRMADVLEIEFKSKAAVREWFRKLIE